MITDRRNFLVMTGATAGSLLLAGCNGATDSPAAPPAQPSSTPPVATPPPVPVPPPEPTPEPPPEPVPEPDPRIARLKAFLNAKASPTAALPALATELPLIAWAGPFGSGPAPTTSLPQGIVHPISDPLISRAIPNHYSSSLPGQPTLAGVPCLGISRSFYCRGNARVVGSVQTLRFRTDAPVFELTGVIPDGTATAVTLIVDGRRVPVKILSCHTGRGSWTVGTVRVDFGSRRVRDIWINTGIYLAFIKLEQGSSLLAVGDTEDPQITMVGDSYLAVSSEVFSSGGAIALSLATRLGVRKIATDGIGGTGYWNSGGDLGNLNDRLPAHAADNSQIYVVMAGVNDYGDIVGGVGLRWPDRNQYESAVQRYLEGLRAAQPDALIVVTAPLSPIPSLSDASYIANPQTNTSGIGDCLYKASVVKAAVQRIAAPWVYIDSLMGTGWLNSSGAVGDVTNLQWFTGGTPGPGTTATYKPGNTRGGGGGGFGGIETVPILSGGRYSQAPDLIATGGSGRSLLLAARIDRDSGALIDINPVCPGDGYVSGGLPTITIDPTFELEPAVLGTPTLLEGTNPNGQYPLPSFAPPGVTESELNNIYHYLSRDTTHPSALGAEYLGRRLARNIFDAVMAL